MPAARPRMHVTPSETVFRLLAELSALTGKPPATIVRELLDEAVPALEMTLQAFRAIADRPEEAKAAVMRMAEQAQQMVTQARLDLDSASRKKPGPKPRKKPGREAAKPR
jgi:hypothetical protein